MRYQAELTEHKALLIEHRGVVGTRGSVWKIQSKVK